MFNWFLVNTHSSSNSNISDAMAGSSHMIPRNSSVKYVRYVLKLLYSRGSFVWSGHTHLLVWLSHVFCCPWLLVDLDRIHLMKSHCYSICTQKSLEPRTVSEQLRSSLSTATGISHHSETHNALPRSMSEMSTFKTDAKSIVPSMSRLSQDVCLQNADMHSAVWPHRQE